MDKFKLIPVKDEDAEVLYSLIIDMATYEKERDEVKTSVEKIKSTICNGKFAKAYIGYYDGKPASYVIYFYAYSSYLGKPSLFIEDLYIQPDYRKHGLGKIMISHMAKQAIEEDCGRLDWTCLDWNKNAIDFYKHIGGKHQEERFYFRACDEDLEKVAKLV